MHLNFDEEDVEEFLVNNPSIFRNLVERHQNIWSQNIRHLIGNANEIRRNIEMMQNILQQYNEPANPVIANNNNQDADGDSDDNEQHGMDDDAENIEIQHLGLGLRVDRLRIQLSPLPHFDDEQIVYTNYDHEESYDLPVHGLNMHVTASNISFSPFEEH